MQQIGRRDLLMKAGVGTVALAAIGVPATTAAAETNTEDGGSVLGAWLITHVDDASPQDPHPTPSKAVVTFASGGALASRDISPPAGEQLGAWTKTGDHAFTATFWGDAGGDPPNGTVKVIVSGKWSGDHISGTFHFSVFDANGTTIFSATGTFSGTRIHAGQ